MWRLIYRLNCRLGHHRYGRRFVWNAGTLFGYCCHCGTDIYLDSRKRWRAPPRGWRVRWGGPTPDMIEDAILLPAPATSEIVPVDPAHRQLVPVRGPDKLVVADT